MKPAFALTTLAAALAACGGGGGESSTTSTAPQSQVAAGPSTPTPNPPTGTTQPVATPTTPAVVDGAIVGNTPHPSDPNPVVISPPQSQAPVTPPDVVLPPTVEPSGRTEQGARPGEVPPAPPAVVTPPPVVVTPPTPTGPVIGETFPVAPPLDNIPANAKTQGAWTGPYGWPVIPIHLTMMGDGRLMSYGTDETGRQTGQTVYSIFTPSQGLKEGHMVLPKQTLADIFCSASIWIAATNQILTVGGDVYDTKINSTTNQGNNSSNLYDPTTNTMKAGRNMALPRWYATTTMMPNGTVFIQGGLGGEAFPEIREIDGSYRSLTGAVTKDLDYWYPRNFLMPDGRIFGYDSYGNNYFINPTGNGSIQIRNQWEVLKFGEAGSAALFRPGMVLQLSAFDNSASVIDFRTGNPTLTPTAPMSGRRQNVSATVLPNGKVLATGGSAVYNDVASAVYSADIWDPVTGRWTQGSKGSLARLYHSIAMLQPDGTVLVGGGGAWGPLNNTNVEFYYPPYLFNASGGMATRPLVTAASTTAKVGGTFSLTVDDAQAPITKVTMIKAPTITHSLNMDQSFHQLTYTRVGNTLTVDMPRSNTEVTPGNYLVFAQTANDVPAQARVIKVDIDRPAVAGNFSIQSQEQTRYLVMNWWRGDPTKEGDFRDPANGSKCTGTASQGGNCALGARKTFRPQAFNIATAPATVAGLIMMDVPQFENGVKTYDHYRLPVEFLKEPNECSFKVQHVRTHSNLEFPLNPPGLEILDHKFNLNQSLCDTYPTGQMTQTWLNNLNAALTTYLGPKAAYNPDAYPYSDPRLGRDPSQP